MITVRVWNAVCYDPLWQGDSTVHLGYLRDLTQLRIPATYNAPWVYLLMLGLSAPVAVPLKLLGAKTTTLLHASLGFAETLLFLLLLIGCQRMGRALWGRVGGLQLAVLVGAFPVVQRIQNIVRPESLQLVLTPWAIVLFLQVAPLARESLSRLVRQAPYLALVAAQTLILAQKIGGGVIVGTVPAFLLCAGLSVRDALRLLLKTVPVVLLGAALLIGVQAVLSGHTPLRHDLQGNAQMLCPEGFRPAPVQFFVSFDLAFAWNDPFRNAHRGSMPEILFIDMYGDYWRYGFDMRHIERPEQIRLPRARYGMTLTMCFALLWLFACVRVLSGAHGPAQRRERGYVLASFLPLLGSALLLTAVALKFYCPEDGDIAKWEYLVWVFALLPVPLVSARTFLSAKPLRVYDALLVGLVMASLWPCVIRTPF